MSIRHTTPFRIGLGLTTSLGLVAVVVAARSRSRLTAPRIETLRHRRRSSRNVQLARLGGSTAANFAVHRARRTFADAQRRDELDRRFELETTEQVVATLGNLKGALMKVGQLASYLDQGLPDHVRDGLAQLQADAPPMSRELVDATVAAELGGPPTAVFAEWDDTPIAAASIGQVHRALTHDGRAVAVKVQYPGVDDAIRSDLRNVDGVFAALSYLFPGLDPDPIVAELQDRLVEELDYVAEAANQQRFAEAYRGHPTIHVPDVVGELSTARVLTTELVTGARFDEMLTWSAEERNLAAETIYRFAFGSLYGLGMFNGDPHPGNYLFGPGGRVSFLDYGLVKHFTAEELEGFGRLIRSVVFESDPSSLREAVEDLGLLDRGADLDTDLVFDYFSHFYEFVRTDGEYTISDAYASETIRRMFDVSGPYASVMRSANVPTSFVVIQRINLGLYAIFGQIGATANWRRIAHELWPWVGGEPSTEMGADIAAWEASRT